MRNSLFAFILILNSTCADSQSISIIDYLEATQENDFNDYVFKSEANEYQFLFNGTNIEWDLKDSVPISIFNQFVKENVYSNNKFPYIINIKNETQQDSIKVTDVGLLSAFKTPSGDSCIPIVIPVSKNIVSENLVEFILLTSTYEGVFVDLFAYDLKKNKVLSYLQLFSSESKYNSCTFLPEINSKTYQTNQISNNIFHQKVNDGFNPIWDRQMIMNEDGHYEILKYNNPLRGSKIYNSRINDPDGYTNVRRYPTSKSSILYKIKNEEEFFIEEYDTNSLWLKVYSYNDQSPGWIHRSRIEKISLIKDNNP